MRFVFVIFFLCIFKLSDAQRDPINLEPDTIPVNLLRITNLSSLVDSFFIIIKSNQNEQLMRLLPDKAILSRTLDSLELSKNPGIVLIKHNYLIYNFKKEIKAFKTKCKKLKINLKSFELTDIQIKKGNHELYNQPYAYVYYFLKKGDKEIIVSITCLDMQGFWFIADDLGIDFKYDIQLPGVVKDKVKVKKKSKN